MKFLILFALVAAASADYHDDTFHFATGGVSSGFQKGAFLQSASPVLAKKYTAFTPAYTQQYASPVYSSAAFVAQPAYSQQYYKAAAAPVVVKSIEQEIPVYQQQYAVKQIAQPVYSQYSTLKQVAQPVYSQQYAVKQVAQPLFAQQYAVKKAAQPVYSQYAAVKEIAQPVYSQYAYKQVAQPAFSQYSVKVAEPAVIAKPFVAQQYSAAALSGVSTYAAGYNAPQFRILSQVQEADPAGPYKLSYSTENGIQASEQGTLVAGAEGAVVAAQGSYSYTGPDGQVYTVNYIADENGFRAAGDHLPTPPPVPAEILKSLEENASSSEQYDDQGRLIYKK